jgi:hypothetical protein
VKRFVSLAVFALLPLSVAADQVTHYPFNQYFDGNVHIDSLNPSQCMATDADKKIVSSGAACGGGGGGVSSVTAGPTANLVISPTTGAVIADLATNPSVAGTITASSASSTLIGFNASSSTYPLEWKAFDGTYDGDQVIIDSDGTKPVAGIDNNVWGLFIKGDNVNVAASDGHTVGFPSLAVADLTGSAGTGVCVNGSLKLTTSGCSGGGGAVSSVTAGPSANLTFAPTTGAVIGDIRVDPTFNNSVTSPLFRTTATGAGSLNQALQLGSTAPGGYSNLLACPSGVNCTVAGNIGTVLALTDTTSIPYFVVDSAHGFTSSGAITSDVALAPAFVSTNDEFAQWIASTADVIHQTSNGTFTVQNVQNSAFGLTDSTNATDLMALSTGGDVGFASGVHATTLNASGLNLNECVQTFGDTELRSSGSPCVPSNDPTFTGTTTVADLHSTGAIFNDIMGANPDQCLQSSISGQIVPIGQPCVVPQHSNEIITATAGSCVAGTPVVFSPAFLSVPEIAGSTGPIPGDTFAPTSITASGFTPEICSTTSNAANTIYWIATAG